MLEISCALPPTPDTPDLVRYAEELGYRRAWIYDTPPLQLDVWMTLALAADRTEQIGIGPGVLVPSNRHVLTTAIGDRPPRIARGRPDRVRVRHRFHRPSCARASGRSSGPTSPTTCGRCARCLRGETVEVDGAMVAMLHGAGQAPSRPIEPPFLVGASGPKGEAVARELGDGVLGSNPIGGFGWSVWLAFGTVIDDDEDLDGERVSAIGRARRGDRLPLGLSAPATDVRHPPWLSRLAGLDRGGRSVGASSRGPSRSSHRAQSTRPHGDDRTDRRRREPQRHGVALA